MRGKGEGSLFKLKGCRFWYASYYQDGRKVRVSTKTDVHAKAAAFLRKMMDDRDKGIVPFPEFRKVTYKELRSGLLANYVEKGNRMTGRADGTETIMGLPQLDEYFEFNEENPGPSAVYITTDVARKFAEKRRADGAGNAVINRSLSCLRRMLKIAVEDRKIQAVPLIRLLKEPPARRGFVTKAQFEPLVRILPTHLRPLILFLYWCGVRLGEALAIEWSQVDLASEVVRLHETKSGEPRIVPIPAELRALLETVEPKVGPVFDDTNLRKEWRKACAAVGLGRIIKIEGKEYDPQYVGLTIHDLRRSAVRNLVQAGNAETTVMKISGHATHDVFKRYAITRESDLVAAMRKVETYQLAEESSVLGNGSKTGRKPPRSARKSMMALSSRG